MRNRTSKLEKRLRREVQNHRTIEISRVESGFEIGIDFKSGFERYEAATLRDVSSGYSVTYFGLFSAAFNTFLDERRERKIIEAHSELLERLKERVKAIKEKKKVERYDEKKDEIYSQLLQIEERTHSFKDCERVMNYFAEIFKEKARDYSVDADS